MGRKKSIYMDSLNSIQVNDNCKGFYLVLFTFFLIEVLISGNDTLVYQAYIRKQSLKWEGRPPDCHRLDTLFKSFPKGHQCASKLDTSQIK